MSEPVEAPDPAAVDPRWLDDDEQHAWLGLGGVILRLHSTLDAQLRRDAGIGHFEYTVLAGLSESQDRTMRMSELAVVAEGSLPRLSQTVNRLEARGWVQRTPDPRDGRYTLAILTDAGMDKVRRAAPGHVAEVRRIIFDRLTRGQVRQLATITRRIMSGIDPVDRCLVDSPFKPPSRTDATASTGADR